MPRIPEAVLEAIREIDSEEVATVLGLEKAREHRKWNCPACGSSDGLHAHGSRKGAFCYVCDTYFDNLSLTQLCREVEFPEAARWLQEQFDIDSNGHRRRQDGGKTAPATRAPTPAQADVPRSSVGNDSAGSPHATLRRVLLQYCKEDPRAAEYLRARGITPEKTEYAEHIRYVHTIEDWWKTINWFSWDELLAAGLVGISERDRSRFSVPWRAPFLVLPYWNDIDLSSFDCVRFRDLTGVGPKYLSLLGISPSAPFMADVAYRQVGDGPLYVVEGELDGLSVWEVDTPAIASPGASMWRSSWCKPWRDLHQVVVVSDGDAAGQKFSQKVTTKAGEVLGDEWTHDHLRSLICPPGKDANDLLLEGTLGEFLAKGGA